MRSCLLSALLFHLEWNLLEAKPQAEMLLVDTIVSQGVSKATRSMLSNSNNAAVPMGFCTKIETKLSLDWLGSYDCTSLIHEEKANDKNQMLFSSDMGLSNVGNTAQGIVTGNDNLENIHLYNWLAFEPHKSNFEYLVDLKKNQKVKLSESQTNTLKYYQQANQSWRVLRKLVNNYIDMHSSLTLGNILDILQTGLEKKYITTFDFERYDINYYRYSLHFVIGGCKWFNNIDCYIDKIAEEYSY